VTEPRPPEDAAAGWLAAHRKPLLFVLLLAAFLCRAAYAARTYLNPDEALHYALVHLPSLAAVYHQSLHEPHPPLYLFLLHFWAHLGRSEFMLRLPGILAGTALAWVACAWLRKILGEAAGWIGLLFFCFAPVLVKMSATARGYILLLLVMAAALWFLEDAFARRSRARMALFGLFLLLALLIDYSAVWFALAAGVYALLRVRRERLPRNLLGAWLGTQLAAAALCALLYVTHVAKLRASALSLQEHSGSLSSLYFQPGKDNPFAFALANTATVFGYAFGNLAVGILAFGVFLIGASLLLDPRALPPGKPPARVIAALLTLPFLVNLAAAFAGLFPYGRTRSDLYLALFAIAGTAYALARLGGKRTGVGLAAAVPILLAGSLYPGQIASIAPRNQARHWMTGAVAYVRQSIPPGTLVYSSDYMSTLAVSYYFCPDRTFPFAALERRRSEFSCGGYRIVSDPPVTATPALVTRPFPETVQEIARDYRLEPGARLWVIHVGWPPNLFQQLRKSYPRLEFSGEKRFGDNVAVIQVAIPRADFAGRASGPAARASRPAGLPAPGGRS
jgi:Dolichyl-phosphate-mannose-protein mannosyltransferase